ncbi:MAG: mechanosensitive ion channel family protein [Burkholderiales bacterium]|nr:mechanosensitive ion channel family protein [Burkholderiales bacterium]
MKLIVRRYIACVALVSLALAAAPQAGGADVDPGKEPEARESLPLKVANRTIIRLRGPIAGYTARERVTSALARIEAALAGEHLPAVSVGDHEYGTRVLVGGKHAFVVTRLDVDPQAGETTRIVAQEAAKRLERALAERREQETPRYLAVHLAYAVAATLLYALIAFALIRVNRWAGARFAGAADRRAGAAVAGTGNYLDLPHLLLVGRRLVTLAAWLVALVIGSGWLTFVLVQFPYTRPWGEELEGNLVEMLKEIALAVAGALPGLVFVVVIFLIARTVIRLARLFFVRVEQGRIEVAWLDADVARPTRKIYEVIVWLFALAMAYPYLPGAQTEAFKGLSVLAGLMVTIGASSVVGQAFSGLILMYTRAFRAGDYVRIGESEGTVTLLGVFATRLRTGLGEEITLPNSSIMSSSMKNYSRAVPGTGYVVDTMVTIGYGTPWRQVHAMLEEAARRTADIAAVPPPQVRQTALADFYIEYRLVAYTPVEHPARRIDVLNRLHGNIQDVFNEHGVQIMSPHYMTDPKEPQVVPKQDWYAAPARPPEGPPPA